MGTVNPTEVMLSRKIPLGLCGIFLLFLIMWNIAMPYICGISLKYKNKLRKKKEKLNLKRFILKLLSLLGYDCSRVDIAPFRKGKKGSQKLSIALAVIYAAVSWVTLSRDNILAELIAIILNGITVIQVLIALYQKSDLSKTLLNFIV